MPQISISEIMNGPWKRFSVASCEDRAIPQFADGLKTVQRFVLANGLKIAKNKFTKVAEIGSGVAGFGYEHGETSACNALTLMSAYFSNNLPLFEGEGSFGNVLDPSPAAPRYIFAKVSEIYDYLFKDTDIAPENPDPEILTPLYYLPIIPMCLVNGIKGIATGYATDIPPHDSNSIIDALIAKCDGKKEIPEIVPKYYLFSGDIQKESDGYVLTGKYEKKSSIHFVITELPHIFNTSASYENFLRKLLDKGVIMSYDNLSNDDKFIFDVTIKRGTRWTDEDIVKKLKLQTKHSWNLTTVMPNGSLHVWDKTTGINDIVNQFYDFRIPFVQKRIDNKIVELNDLVLFYSGFIKFINAVINGEINLKTIEESTLETIIKTDYSVPEKFVSKIMNAPMRTLTKNQIAILEEKLKDTQESLEYYKNTTKEKEYKNDLNELKKVIKTIHFVN